MPATARPRNASRETTLLSLRSERNVALDEIGEVAKSLEFLAERLRLFQNKETNKTRYRSGFRLTNHSTDGLEREFNAEQSSGSAYSDDQ
jgi:hypothetical protein